MTKSYRYERMANPPVAFWQGRPAFNLYGNDSIWIGRVADETLDRAEQHARLHPAVPLVEAAHRAIRVFPDATIAFCDHTRCGQWIGVCRSRPLVKVAV
jgi:hypothetical protein